MKHFQTRSLSKPAFRNLSAHIRKIILPRFSSLPLILPLFYIECRKSIEYHISQALFYSSNSEIYRRFLTYPYGEQVTNYKIRFLRVFLRNMSQLIGLFRNILEILSTHMLCTKKYCFILKQSI